MTNPPKLGRRTLLVLTLTALPCCTSFDDAVADQGYLDLADAARLCTNVFSCGDPGQFPVGEEQDVGASLRASLGLPVDATSFSRCLTWFAGPVSPRVGGLVDQRATLATATVATSCAELVRGLDVQVFAAGNTSCAASPGIDACTAAGDVKDCHRARVVRCPGARLTPGSTCQTSGAVARCATDGLCKNRCVSSTILGLCELGTGLTVNLVCASTGTSCQSKTLNGPLLSTDLCTNDITAEGTCVEGSEGRARCAGAKAVRLCHEVQTLQVAKLSASFSFEEAIFDCAAFGASCLDGPGDATAICAAPAAECSPDEPDVDRCEGDAITVCLAGKRRRVDCAAIGAVCQPASSGRSAHCSNSPG